MTFSDPSPEDDHAAGGQASATARAALDLSDVDDLIAERPRVLLVGLGKAGGRFLRSLRYLEETFSALELAGVCDTDGLRFGQLQGSSTQCFTDLRTALEETAPDVVCVCINEVGHYDALAVIAEFPSVRAVLSEKPLTETLAQCEAVIDRLGDRLICVNFVERYSPVVEQFREWSVFHDAQVLRVEFHWGKYRFMDPRPTMGVLSEISHPVDLVRILIGARPDAMFTVRAASGSRSRFSVVDRALLDTVDVAYTVDGVPVRGHSSFLWEGRDRRIVLYGRTSLAGALFQAVLAFDRPSWDCDSLRVTRVDESTGAREEVFASHCDRDDFPRDLKHIFKVTRFCAVALRALYQPEYAEQLALAEDAWWTQRAIDAFSEAIGGGDAIGF
ncbi:Gfo/Idh/MocA family oxidoreductase [Streptomyces erythrochromogenes]|uniref:Gfo/Idh/MocA family protein n=1 Tax=Streptomyces erythrochromogenes TaxID=285574 RepID=UPI0034167112